MVREGNKVILPIVGLTLLLLAWHFYVVVKDVQLAVLPAPVVGYEAVVNHRRHLIQARWVPFSASVDGLRLAFLVGVPIAVAITSSRTLNLMFFPLLIATQSLPKVALAPLLLVWLGIGIESKLAIAWLVAFFPIVVDTATGLRATPEEFLDLARSTRATAWQTFYKIRFPAAFPFVMSGCKVAITLAVVGAVIGEFVGSTEGLGNLLLVANSQLNTPLAFAALVALSVLGIALYLAVVAVEVALQPWLGEQHGR